MAIYQPWIGTCHYRDTETGRSFECLAAVWANGRDSFEERLRKTLHAQNGDLIWTEDALPAMERLSRFGHETTVIGLSKSVHDSHRVEFGKAEGIDAPVSPQNDYLIIEEIDGVEPLDAQFGVADKKTVPDRLYEHLFGQPAYTEREIERYGFVGAVPPLKTYAILDAAKVQFLTSYLERSELPYKCLFKGRSAEELKDVSPYIVELFNDNNFTRNLFTSAGMPSNMWEREPGIYIRSRASLDDLWKHFRKFTKARDDKGTWYYIKYWEPAFFVDYILSMRPEKQKIIIGDCDSFVIARNKKTRHAIKNQSSSSSSSSVSVMGNSGEL